MFMGRSRRKSREGVVLSIELRSEDVGNCDIIPSCFDCLFQPAEIDYYTFYCKAKQKRHWLHEGVCAHFIPDYESIEELMCRYPEMAND